MSIVINSVTIGSSGNGFPVFTYMVNGVDKANDPSYVEVVHDVGRNWRIRFLQSGTLMFSKLGSASSIDLFLVGGGGGGASSTGEIWSATGGGAGGYTFTIQSIMPVQNQSYAIVVGNGGTAGNDGDASVAFGHTANGGGAGGKDTQRLLGGDGGSGGGGFFYGYESTGGAYGGSDGSNGYSGNVTRYGLGQGTTTREFGESNGALYAGGGAAGYGYDNLYKTSTGGAGGGGDSGYGGNPNSYKMTYPGSNGTPNTGGGGGGRDGEGGSGIVIIRNHRKAS